MTDYEDLSRRAMEAARDPHIRLRQVEVERDRLREAARRVVQTWKLRPDRTPASAILALETILGPNGDEDG